MRAMDWVQTEQAVDGNTNMEITETANPMEISDLTRPVQESIVRRDNRLEKAPSCLGADGTMASEAILSRLERYMPTVNSMT
jgi:hypothetical protein